LLGVVDQQHVVQLVVVGVVHQDVEHHAAEQLLHLLHVDAAFDHAAPAQQLRELQVVSISDSRAGLSRKRNTRLLQRSGRTSSTAPGALSRSCGRNSCGRGGRSSLSAKPRCS
jgi:hypothetical protein